VRKIIVVIVLVALVAVAASAATYWSAFAVFQDNSCRQVNGTYLADGRACMYDTMTIWCDPASPTCQALSAPKPVMPRCDGSSFEPSDEPVYGGPETQYP
jgi:hypothetical protein